MVNPNPVEAYTLTKLFEGGKGDDREGVFTQRTTYGVMKPDATHGVRVQAERSLVPSGNDLNTEVTLRPLTQYIGNELSFNEGRDGFDDVVTGDLYAKIGVAFLSAETVHTLNSGEVSDEQLANIARFVGYQAIQLGEQLNEIMGNQQ
ncbi:MAG TPA: hypothetical protein VLG11_06000 [Candidatus Saccharimonadales bacterium]|nr:hypothetical protein [Candidatus Saccharimonadales bacterium]